MSLFFIMILISTSLKSQTISYPVSANPISVSFDSTLLTVQVSDASANPAITITLPGGVYYIPGSFSFKSGSGTVIESGSLTVPIFTIKNATIPFSFTIERRADCAARTLSLDGSTFKDIVKVDGVTENSPLLNTYSIKYATLTITQPTSLTNIVLESGKRGN